MNYIVNYYYFVSTATVHHSFQILCASFYSLEEVEKIAKQQVSSNEEIDSYYIVKQNILAEG